MDIRYEWPRGLPLRPLRPLDFHSLAGFPRLGGSEADGGGFGSVVDADAGGLPLEHAVHELLNLNEVGFLISTVIYLFLQMLVLTPA